MLNIQILNPIQFDTQIGQGVQFFLFIEHGVSFLGQVMPLTGEKSKPIFLKYAFFWSKMNI
jgi:hypothetical protein